MNIKVAIFDWDGTIVDSVEHITDSLHKAAAALGFPVLEKAAYRNIIGLGMEEALNALYPGTPAGKIQDIRRAYSDFFFSREATPQQLFQGLGEILHDLRTAGSGRAVATGKSRRGLDKALHSTRLQAHFDITRCADETRSKPDPAMLREILAFYDIRPHEAVMIGDKTYDMEMAERIGMPAIGVQWGVHTSELLARHSPRAIVDSVPALRRELGLKS